MVKNGSVVSEVTSGDRLPGGHRRAGRSVARCLTPTPSPERAQKLGRRHPWPPTAEVITAWRNFILHEPNIGRTYALHLVDHVNLHRAHTVIAPKEPGGRKAVAMLASIA